MRLRDGKRRHQFTQYSFQEGQREPVPVAATSSSPENCDERAMRCRMAGGSGAALPSLPPSCCCPCCRCPCCCRRCCSCRECCRQGTSPVRSTIPPSLNGPCAWLPAIVAHTCGWFKGRVDVNAYSMQLFSRTSCMRVWPLHPMSWPVQHCRRLGSNMKSFCEASARP